ncbi:GNAT family N-acetyltransferase [Streptosporangium sandarakinum]|uniref:GNAT family N-acetyltransferase n=1 Tax=Streptosporangium sandarakinum TaxID=1260955 RepID=UPI0037B01442
MTAAGEATGETIGAVTELTRAADVVGACGSDALLLWAAQGARPGVRAWTCGQALAVACPDLNRRDRMAVRGPAPQVAALVRSLAPWLGPQWRLLGEWPLMEELARLLGVEPVGFEWMDTDRPPPPATATGDGDGDGDGDGGVRWLDDADAEVAALLQEASPSAWARPGVAGVRRWAGLRDGSGRLIATAADAWSCPQVGFVAGVATAPAHRGRGHAERVCRFVLAELVAACGRGALMVDSDNPTAIGVYERLGLRRRTVAASPLTGG